MKRKRHSEETIIGILREVEAGMSVSDVCRKHGVSQASFCAWRTKCAGMQVSDAFRLAIGIVFVFHTFGTSASALAKQGHGECRKLEKR